MSTLLVVLFVAGRVEVAMGATVTGFRDEVKSEKAFVELVGKAWDDGARVCAVAADPAAPPTPLGLRLGQMTVPGSGPPRAVWVPFALVRKKAGLAETAPVDLAAATKLCTFLRF